MPFCRWRIWHGQDEKVLLWFQITRSTYQYRLRMLLLLWIQYSTVICATEESAAHSSREKYHCAANTKSWDMALTTTYRSCWHCGAPCINPMQIAPLTHTIFLKAHFHSSYIYTHKHTHQHSPQHPPLRDIISCKQLPDTQKAERQIFFFPST